MDKYTVSGEGNGGRILPASVNQGNTPEDTTRFRSRSAEKPGGPVQGRHYRDRTGRVQQRR